MVIKVEKIVVPQSEPSAIAPVFYGIVTGVMEKSVFNMCRHEGVFDEELVFEKFIPNETLVRYSHLAIRGEEIMQRPSSEDKLSEQVVYHYLFLGDGILSVETNMSDLDDNKVN